MDIHTLFRRLNNALSGIWYALRYDKNFRLQVVGGFVVLTIFIFVFLPLSNTELLFLFLGWALVLITELQNSAFEAALDRLHPDHHDDIGKSKDMAAGAVLTAAAFLGIVMLVIMFL